MDKKLNILIIEDSESDLGLVTRILNKSSLLKKYLCVETADDFKQALQSNSFDVILADYELPQFNAPAALEILKKSGLDIPFIVVTGNVGEDVAVKLMKKGAHDYLLKKELTRLPEAIRREVSEAQIRLKRRQAENEIQERATRLELIADIGKRTTAILELQELLQQTVTLVKETFDYYNVVIWLENGKYIVLQATALPKERQFIGKARLKIGVEGITGWVAKNGRQLCVPDVSKDKRYYKELEKVKTNSELAVPIRLKDKIIGVLDAQSTQLDAFKKIDVFTLQTIADQLAIAIENARLFEAAQVEIAERKLAEEALQRSEEKFRQLFMDLPDAIFLSRFACDNAGQIVNVNPAAERQTGYSRDELIGMNILQDLVLQEVKKAQDVQREKELLKRNSIQFSEKKRRKDGSEYWTEVVITLIEYENEKVALSVNRDITEQKQAEEEIRKLTLSVEQSPASIVITDLQGNIEYVNPTFSELTGYSLDEVKGKNPNVLKSGEMSADEYKKLWDTISSGRVWRGEFHNKKKNGELYWESAIISPIKNSEGAATHYLAVKEDITEIKQLQQQLIQAQKMETIGQLAGGVAHDFNNMLGVILGYSELLLMKIDPSQMLHSDLQEIQKAALNSTNLTRQLLTFARKQAVIPQVLDLNETINGIIKMLKRLISEQIELCWKPESDLWAIKIDPSQVNQILANLCVNARDAIKGVGKITIKTNKVSVDQAYCVANPGLVPGEYVLLTVSDNGSGIDENIIDKIFEPFFTTKDVGKGTGLGLATIYGIVKQNDGYIYVYSEPEQGTTFKVYLHRHSDTDRIDKDKEQEIPIVYGRETILLVEDEQENLEMTKKMLERLGYHVLAASTPSEAIRLAGEYADDIDLLLTDVIMPEMNGRSLAKKLVSEKPDLKYIFMSGYSGEVFANGDIKNKDVYFIQKPFSLNTLATEIRKVVESKLDSMKR